MPAAAAAAGPACRVRSARSDKASGGFTADGAASLMQLPHVEAEGAKLLGRRKVRCAGGALSAPCSRPGGGRGTASPPASLLAGRQAAALAWGACRCVYDLLALHAEERQAALQAVRAQRCRLRTHRARARCPAQLQALRFRRCGAPTVGLHRRS